MDHEFAHTSKFPTMAPQHLVAMEEMDDENFCQVLW